VGTRSVDVVVIGAGQAGLSSAWALAHQGFEPATGFVVLDGDLGPGGAWQHRWPSLTVGTTHRVHDLPGLAFEPDAGNLRAADVVPAYFAEYERRFDLPVHRPVHVRAVSRTDDGSFLVRTDQGDWTARAVVNATGTWTRPFVPRYPGQETFAGRQLHTVDYRDAAEFAGQHVVVVGGGASAVQLLGEISQVASTTWVTRHPPVWREGPFDEEAGRRAVALVEEAVREGRRPGSVVGVTGLLTSTPYIRDALDRGVLERLPMFDRITEDGVA
jgi:cation diffusion facilitator CzcD-associated flavoprotein CzcO